MNSGASVTAVSRLFALYSELQGWNRETAHSRSTEAHTHETVPSQHLLSPLLVSLFTQSCHYNIKYLDCSELCNLVYFEIITILIFSKVLFLGLTVGTCFFLKGKVLNDYFEVCFLQNPPAARHTDCACWLTPKKATNDLFFFAFKVQEWNKAL